MLPSPDPTLLTAIVRQDQRDPHFELLDWEVELLSDKGIINPGGLVRRPSPDTPGLYHLVCALLWG